MIVILDILGFIQNSFLTMKLHFQYDGPLLHTFMMVHMAFWKLSNLLAYLHTKSCTNHNLISSSNLLLFHYLVEIQSFFSVKLSLIFCYLLVFMCLFRMQCGVEVHFFALFSAPIRDRFSWHMFGTWCTFSVWCLTHLVLQLGNYSL